MNITLYKLYEIKIFGGGKLGKVFLGGKFGLEKVLLENTISVFLLFKLCLNSTCYLLLLCNYL